MECQVCKQFGELPDHLKDKLKYSSWRATEIQNALREGRTPDPPTTPVDMDIPADPHTNVNGQNDVSDADAAAAIESALAEQPDDDPHPSVNHSSKKKNSLPPPPPF